MTAYSQEVLLGLYRTMVRIRQCEESLVEPILEREIGTPCHLYSGQEAIAAGVCAALEQKDYIFGSHRSHGHFLAKGGSMEQMVAEIFCREDGCSRGRGGSMHLIDPEHGMLGSAPIVAGTISLAVGAALAARVRGEDRVAVSFFGDGATGEGVLYESLNFAALRKLPVIFVCENNLYSTHLPISECRITPEIYKVGEPFCVESHRLDGNDVLEVHSAAVDAVAKCRAGEGPVFLECLTYRMRGHVGPDDNIQGTHTDIRPEEEIAKWRLKDPIGNFARYLLEQGLAGQQALDQVDQEAAREVEQAIKAAKNGARPSRENLGRYVFAALD